MFARESGIQVLGQVDVVGRLELLAGLRVADDELGAAAGLAELDPVAIRDEGALEVAGIDPLVNEK